jgi:hypothetical protein
MASLPRTQSRDGGATYAARLEHHPNANSDDLWPLQLSLTPNPIAVGGNEAEGLMQEADEKPFELKGLDIAVPKGSFVAIVGRVGLGKVGQLMWVHLAG